MQAYINFPQDTSRALEADAPRCAANFANPMDICEAYSLDEVLPALSKLADYHAQQQYWCVGFVAYEAAAAFDHALMTHASDVDLPLVYFAVYARQSVESVDFSTGASFPYPCHVNAWQDVTLPTQFHQDFVDIKEAIVAGDYYQLNYTTRLQTQLHGDARTYFDALSQVQPNGYQAYLSTNDWSVLSLSPELFFDWQDGVLTTQPMKGTAPRGATPQEDAQFAKALQESSKERAENVMIVDLLRNDIAKVAQTGTVKVTKLFELHALPTVWQMTSTIQAKTKPEVSLVDIFRALFPCGSVTGAPKVQAMKDITQLEPSARGVYCGAIGVLTPEGRATFNVAIRTVQLTKNNQQDKKQHQQQTHNLIWQAQAGVGSGITWDAIAENEAREFTHKTNFLTQTLPSFQLLETCLLEQGDIWLLEEHLARLQQSASTLGFVYDDVLVRNALLDLARDYADEMRRVRLLLSADGNVLVESFTHQQTQSPARIQLAAAPIVWDVQWLQHKTTQRGVYDAFAPTDANIFDTLLWNQKNEITEFTRGNVVVRLDGVDYTPPLSCGVLPGVYRAYLIAQGLLQERVILKHELEHAQAVYFMNSLRGQLKVEF